MTEVQIEAPSGMTTEGAYYVSPRGLYPFQADGIAQAYMGVVDGSQPERMFAWDTGLGKSHAAMQLAALGFEDGIADLIVIICERNKLKEWEADFKEFTRLEPRIHHGASRKSKLAKFGLPDVVITSWETGRADLVSAKKTERNRKVLESGELLHSIAGRRPMIFFDEADKLSNRSSGLYKAYDHTLKTLRKTFKNLPVFMMTATTIRRDFEGAFNQLRLLRPQAMPLVREFKDYFVRGRDIYGRAQYFDHRVDEFVAICQPLLLTKSKEDPDVVAQFPAMTEESLWVDLEGEQRKLYDLVADLDAPGMLHALRQICAHPAALLHSATEGSSKLSRALVSEFGEDYIRALPSAKTEALVAYVEPIVKGQGDKAVVFSFFGPSVLPHVRKALEAKGLTTWMLSEKGGEEAFKTSSEPGVLLTSDAGARGVNWPQASYLIEFDMATTFGLRTQRLNRISRIGQGGPTATVRTMLARNSVEVPLMWGMLRGHGQSDALLGRGVTGEDCMTAAMRRALLTQGMEI